MAGESDKASPSTQTFSPGRSGRSSNGANPRPRPPGPNDVQPSSGKGRQAPGKKNPLMQPRPWWISFLIVLVLNYLLVQVFLPERPNPRIQIPYTFFKQQVVADNVSEVTSQGDTIQGTFAAKIRYPAGDPRAVPTTLFSTEVPAFWSNGQLTALLQTRRVQVNARSTSSGTSLLGSILLGFGPTLLLVGLFVLLAWRAQAGGAGEPVALRPHADDLGMRMLRDLPDQGAAIGLRHPVIGLDLLLGRDLRRVEPETLAGGVLDQWDNVAARDAADLMRNEVGRDVFEVGGDQPVLRLGR